MILHPPMVITSRLLPGLHVGSGADLAAISIEPGKRPGPDGKPTWRVTFDLPGRKRGIVDDSLRGWGDERAMLGALCSFLTACAESRRYGRGGRERGENADLFPESIGEWAEQWSDEIGMIGVELEEGGDRE